MIFRNLLKIINFSYSSISVCLMQGILTALWSEAVPTQRKKKLFYRSFRRFRSTRIFFSIIKISKLSLAADPSPHLIAAATAKSLFFMPFLTFSLAILNPAPEGRPLFPA